MGQHLKPKVLKALQGSIKKWEDILAGKMSDQGSNNCPLCQLFVNRQDNCDGCPVQRHTGCDSCGDTPYTKKWAVAGRDAIHSQRDWAMTDDQILAARAELDFLRSLLPARLRPRVPR